MCNSSNQCSRLKSSSAARRRRSCVSWPMWLPNASFLQRVLSRPGVVAHTECAALPRRSNASFVSSAPATSCSSRAHTWHCAVNALHRPSILPHVLFVVWRPLASTLFSFHDCPNLQNLFNVNVNGQRVNGCMVYLYVYVMFFAIFFFFIQFSSFFLFFFFFLRVIQRSTDDCRCVAFDDSIIE